MRYETRLQTVPQEIWAKIARIDELKGQWSAGVKLHPQVLTNLKKSVLITSSGASTRIEGAKLSDEKIEEIMQGIAIQKFADRDSQEVRGYYELLQNVFNAWSTIRFGENTVKHFHKELLKYVEKDAFHRGDYKKQENKVIMVDAQGQSTGVLFETAPAYLTPKLMQELTEWTAKALENAKYHPLLVIGNFIVEFLAIHPFTDGNGRLSRILTNLLLLKTGYGFMPYVSHEKLIEEKKVQYYIALRKSQKTFATKNEDLTPWLDFFLDIVLAQANQAINLITEERFEIMLSQRQMAVWDYLGTVDEASPMQMSVKLNIPRPTVSQALAKLVKLKKVERLGLGSNTRYRRI